MDLGRPWAQAGQLCADLEPVEVKSLPGRAVLVLAWAMWGAACGVDSVVTSATPDEARPNQTLQAETTVSTQTAVDRDVSTGLNCPSGRSSSGNVDYVAGAGWPSPRDALHSWVDSYYSDLAEDLVLVQESDVYARFELPDGTGTFLIRNLRAENGSSEDLWVLEVFGMCAEADDAYSSEAR